MHGMSGIHTCTYIHITYVRTNVHTHNTYMYMYIHILYTHNTYKYILTRTHNSPSAKPNILFLVINHVILLCLYFELGFQATQKTIQVSLFTHTHHSETLTHKYTRTYMHTYKLTHTHTYNVHT